MPKKDTNVEKVGMSQSEKTAIHRKQFIDKIAPYSEELYKEYKILPSVTIAQAILESDWGDSVLAYKYNNYFGVKGTDPKTTVLLPTKEFSDGKWITIKGRFQIYKDYKESMKEHAQLLAFGTTWNSQQYYHVVHADDYVSAAKGLKDDGYATDPRYTKKIIHIIRKYHLDKYDPK